MSLVLLFPSIPTSGAVFCWSGQAAGTLSWALTPGDYRHRWADWAGVTWGSAHDASYSWSYMAGQTFNVNSTQGTTWTLQDVAVQNCPV